MAEQEIREKIAKYLCLLKEEQRAYGRKESEYYPEAAKLILRLLKESGYVRLHPDQSLPNISPYTDWDISIILGMYKEGFRRVILDEITEGKEER